MVSMRMKGRRSRRRRGGERPLWGATPVDLDVSQAYPLEGWVILKEKFVGMEHHVPGTDVVLTIHRPYVHNSVFGTIIKVHPETSEEFGIFKDDVVIYLEYSGGRWAFNGEKYLITPVYDILAKIK